MLHLSPSAGLLLVVACCCPGLTASTLIGEHVGSTEQRQRALHEDSSSAAAVAPAPSCCNTSSFRENVIIGGGSSMGPIVKTRTTMDCCNRCQSNAACGCWTWRTGNHDCMIKNASQCHGEQAHEYRFSGSVSRPCTTPPGPPPGPPAPPHQGSLVVVPPADAVPINGIAEWTITIENATIRARPDDQSRTTASAWEALNVTLDLLPPPGTAPYNASHRGFLYAGSVWKVRAALRSPGRYSYKLSATWKGSPTPAHRSEGTAMCSSTAAPQNHSVGSRGFLRPRFGMPPFRTAYEDGSLFTGLGLGDCLTPDLNFLTYNETDGSQFNRSLEEYTSDYGMAGFNIFRWSNGNCAWRIEESFDGNPGRPVGNIYSEKYVLLLDRLFDTFRAAGMSMWSLPFAKDSRAPLFPSMGDGDTKYHLAQREAIEKHLEFVVARWGAQTDIWSLLNEQRADTGWLTVAAEYVRSIDPYHHPITSSWNDHVNMTQIEIDSVHWYYGDTHTGTKGSAAAAAAMIDAELAHGKPVFFTESGNRAHNWDFDSHTRMRIRSWVAFFKSAALMWWNTAGTRTCRPCGGGNMYLGPLERSYNLILRRFADHMVDPAVQPLDVRVNIPGMNTFGLHGGGAGGDSVVVMVYLHHNASHAVNVSTGVSFSSSIELASCTGDWIHPADGSSTPALHTNSSAMAPSPLFSVDMAMRLTCTGTPGPPAPPPPPLPPPPPPAPSDGVGGTRYANWAQVQGSNYVPSYSTNDVKDIFRPGFWNADTIDRELSYAKLLAVNSLRIFVSHGGFASSSNSTAFLDNYRQFQLLAQQHNLTLLVTLGTGERAAFGNCSLTTDFVNAVVSAEVSGVVIAYEADNEPTGYMINYLINCTLPALNAASQNPAVDISVGVAHVGEVSAVKHLVTTLNWHSYNGQENGGGLFGEINEVQKYVNKFDPPKQLVLTEWLARPAQPLASAYPVLRDNNVAGYNWALVIVDCTSHWNRPVKPGDPPFQGMVWPNGTVFDDLEEGECMRTQCRTLKYVHHCCNNKHADGEALDRLWNFSGAHNGSDWTTKFYGSPQFKLPGPREGSMRWTNTSGATVAIGPLPTGTKRAALYLPVSPRGAEYTVQLDGTKIYAGTTLSNVSSWVARTVLSIATGAKMLHLTVGTTEGATQFGISGVTLFSGEPAPPPPPTPPSPHPAPPTPPSGCNASTFRTDVIIGGTSMGSIVATHTPMDCCQRCEAYTPCSCWTWRTGNHYCMLKNASQCNRTEAHNYRVSGMRPDSSQVLKLPHKTDEDGNMVTSKAQPRTQKTWFVNVSDPKASDSPGSGSESVPFKSISPAAAIAQPGDTVLVGRGIYRERIAPARSGTLAAPITYTAAPGEKVFLKGSNVVNWTARPDGTYEAELPLSLFDTLDGQVNGTLYNPFVDPMQPGAGCRSFTTGQVYANGERLGEFPPNANVKGCKVGALSTAGRPSRGWHTAAGCFSVLRNGSAIAADFGNSSSLPDEIEVTVRSRVFAPHKRGLAHIIVQGFIIEHGANQWIENFWYPQNAKYSQSGLLGTRSGFMWTIRNNTIRKAQTIALDIGVEGGYTGAWPPPDNEGTMQPTPNITGNHTVIGNILEDNGASGIQGYVATGTISFNVIRHNGALGCAGAENAAVKTHGFEGVMEGNLIYGNSELPIWFDSGYKYMRFTRNAIVNNQPGSNGAGFELSFGPALVDNNIFLGAGGGTGVTGMDASGVTYVHNLALGYGSGSVSVYGLTGRTCGGDSSSVQRQESLTATRFRKPPKGRTCAISNWTVAANLLLGGKASPWVKIHCDKHGSHGEDLVEHDFLSHNFYHGTAADFSRSQDKSKCTKPPGVELTGNQDVNGTNDFLVTVDTARMTLSMTPGAAVAENGCVVGGPGGELDFTGAKRNPTKCTPGPLDGLEAGQVRTVSLIPTQGVAPPILPPPAPPPPPPPPSPHPPPTPPAPPTPPTQGCNASTFHANVIIGGESMGPIIATHSPMNCCQRCEAHVPCSCWTWRTGNHYCMLKNASQCSGTEAHKYRVSGSISRP